jgi:hypothetical protein
LHGDGLFVRHHLVGMAVSALHPRSIKVDNVDNPMPLTLLRYWLPGGALFEFLG